MDGLVAMLRAAGDPTRLRLLLLLRQAELTVSELIEIVGQSQPRVSRHLKLLGEAGCWSASRKEAGSFIALPIAARARNWAPLWRPWPTRPESADTARLAAVRQARAAAAAAYFKANAPEWERIRALACAGERRGSGDRSSG